jgi:hypothetical protein
MNTSDDSSRAKRVLMLVLALGVLVPSLWGFGTKFLEFIALYRGDVEGAFAISPILNYLLASTGFLCLFGWAALGGMFRDVEQPKRTMLDNERRLDRTAPWRHDIRLDYPLRHPVRLRGDQMPLGRRRFGDFYDHD